MHSSAHKSPALDTLGLWLPVDPGLSLSSGFTHQPPQVIGGLDRWDHWRPHEASLENGKLKGKEMREAGRGAGAQGKSRR